MPFGRRGIALVGAEAETEAGRGTSSTNRTGLKYTERKAIKAEITNGEASSRNGRSTPFAIGDSIAIDVGKFTSLSYRTSFAETQLLMNVDGGGGLPPRLIC